MLKTACPGFLSAVRARHTLIGAVALLAVTGLLFWWVLPLGDDPPRGTINFSTGTKDGVYQDYGERLRTAFAKDMPGLKVELEESDGSQDNVRRVATGKADFTIAAADAVGTYQREHRQGAGDLRGVARLYDDYVHLVVPAASDVSTVADLKGKDVSIGPPGSGVRLIADRVLRAAGLTAWKDFTPHYDGIDAAPDKLVHGGIDAFFWSGGLPTGGLADLADRFDFRFVPIDGAVVTNLHELGDVARYYRTTNMPESAYFDSSDGRTVPTIAVSNLLITRKGVDPHLTEWITRTVIDSRDRIGRHVHSAQLVDVRTAIYTDPLVLAAGARRYYRSVKS